MPPNLLVYKVSDAPGQIHTYAIGNLQKADCLQ